MKKIALLVLLTGILACQGCASLGNQWVRSTSTTLGGDYRVTLYSGGKAIRAWEIKNGIVNEEEQHGGWYFSCGSHLVRLSGDVVVEPISERQADTEPFKCN